MPAHSAWARWRALPVVEQRATLWAAALIPLAHVALRTLGVRRTLRLIDASALPASADRRVEAERVAHAVSRAARRGWFHGNCLSQSTALLYLLRRSGIEAGLRFGAHTRDGAFAAHAWVEHGGLPLNDTGSVGERFTPLVDAARARRR